MQKKVVFIYGSTASGKSDFAEKLGQHIPIEIVNMDSAQVYEPLTIGTAKPDWKNSLIKQHLFDIKKQPEHLTVHAYRLLVEKKIDEICNRGHIPILVGGSGFYLKSLLFKLLSQKIPEEARNTLSNMPDLMMWQKLKKIDPERAAAIHPHDRYRVKRALEIWFATGKKPSECQPIYDPIAPFILVYITRDKKVLYNRINQRVIRMIEAGWIEEVKQLLGTPWELFVQDKNIIGYSELIGYLKHMYDMQHVVELIAQRTRNYAKKQATFWRMLKKTIINVQKKTGRSCGKIVEFDLTSSEDDLYIKQLLNEISTLDCGSYESN